MMPKTVREIANMTMTIIKQTTGMSDAIIRCLLSMIDRIKMSTREVHFIKILRNALLLLLGTRVLQVQISSILSSFGERGKIVQDQNPAESSNCHNQRVNF
jgi:hypothetical protein